MSTSENLRKSSPSANYREATLRDLTEVVRKSIGELRKVKCYIAGPMRGVPDYNYPAFDGAAYELRSAGWRVFNPAEEEPGRVQEALADDNPLRVFMKRDLPQLVQCDVVFVLPGWAESEGASLEVEVAKRLKIPVYDFTTLWRVEFADAVGWEWEQEDSNETPYQATAPKPGEIWEVDAAIASLPWEVSPDNPDRIDALAGTPWEVIRGARHPMSQRFHELLEQAGHLHDLKQGDYGRGNDPFANVRSSLEWGLDPWLGAMVRLNDKVKRLQQLATKGHLVNESAKDSFMDIAVYALIAYVLYEEQYEPDSRPDE